MSELEQSTIAVVCNYQIRPDRIGGMDRFFKAFNTKAQQKGFAVHWFFTNSSKFEFYDGLYVFSQDEGSIEAYFLKHISDVQYSYNYVITHFVELCTVFYKNIKKQNQNTKIVSVDHNPRPFSGYKLKKKIKNRIKGVLYAKYIDVFVGVSNYTKRQVLKDYGGFLDKKSKVIYNGIYTQLFLKRNELNNNKFIVASHLRQSKGIQDLIQALTKIDKKLISKVHIDIYGEGPLEDILKASVKENELTNYVFFKGSSSELHLKFKDYSYLLQPTYMECFSLSILESLSANVPVITTEVGGNLEVITHGKNGFVFPAGNSDQLALILTDILTNRKGITEDVSRNISDNYYLDKMVDQHLNLLQCI